MRVAKIKLQDGRIILSRVHQVKKNVISTLFGTFKWDDVGMIWQSVSMPGVTAKVESSYLKYTLWPKIVKVVMIILVHERWGLLAHLITIFWLLMLIFLVLVYCFFYVDRYLMIIAKLICIVGGVWFSLRGLPVQAGVSVLWLIAFLLTEIGSKLEKK